MLVRYTVCKDPEGAFVAAFPNLPGCVTQAQTEEELEEKIRDAASLYVAELREKGMEIPEFVGLRELEIG